jgi:hypothetical protein
MNRARSSERNCILASPVSRRSWPAQRYRTSRCARSLWCAPGSPESGCQVLVPLDGEGEDGLLELFLARYVYNRIPVIAERLARSTDLVRAQRKEEDLQRMVENLVHLQLPGDALRVDWSGAEGRKVIDDSLRAVFDALAVLVDRVDTNSVRLRLRVAGSPRHPAASIGYWTGRRVAGSRPSSSAQASSPGGRRHPQAQSCHGSPPRCTAPIGRRCASPVRTGGLGPSTSRRPWLPPTS